MQSVYGLPQEPKAPEPKQTPMTKQFADKVKQQLNLPKLKNTNSHTSFCKPKQTVHTEESQDEAIKELVSFAQQHGYYPANSHLYSKMIQDELSWQQQQLQR